MSNEAVQSILERTVSDEGFRGELFADPDAALAGYDLTAEEATALRALCEETEQSESVALDQRQTKSLPLWLV